jgi:hypothetical protein
MKDNEPTFELACVRKTETDKAVLLVDDSTGEEIWIPLSQVHEMHFDSSGIGRCVMSQWIAKQKGLV